MIKIILTLTAIFAFVGTSFSQYAVGHTTINFSDPNRGGRTIETEIYYPANTAGDNVAIVAEEFPVIVFGHGFVMAWDAYQNIWEELIPQGYIMAFPRTEGNIFSTDHQQFGWDLQFLVGAMQDEGANPSSILYNSVAEETALMGHSMGGGAAFLAADSLSTNGSPYLKTLIGLAPAESTTNGVSSINSAKSIDVKSVIFSGQQDGVTPPNDHHIPMYDSLASNCKTFINVIGGAHCYFANSNFQCDFGEGTSSSGISITREEQHQVLFDFVKPWLAFTLKGECNQFAVFQDSLSVSTRITSNQNCNYVPLTVSSTTTNVACFGDATGAATLSITGGTAAYNEDWGGNDPNALSAGTYSVIVSDADGCQEVESITITESPAISVTSSTTSENCGSGNGTATLSISGGAGGFTENWSGLNPNALPAGIHPVVVTDANGCSLSETVAIGSVGGPVVVASVVDVSCFGLSDGDAILAITGGTPGYTEDWGTANPTALAAGSYNVTVTDGAGCSTIETIEVVEPSQIVVSSTTNPENCGSMNGNATLSISGGEGSYTEDWGGENPTALAAGNYNVTVTDGAGCSTVETVAVSEPSQIMVSSVTNPENCGLMNGDATLTISGGQGGYSEDWSGSNSAALSSGIHTVVVTDAGGCSVSHDVSIGSIGGPVVTSSVTSVSCFGDADGSATLTISGGTPGYTEDWGSEDPTMLSAGMHTVTVTDGAGCSTVETVSILEPTAIQLIANGTDEIVGDDGSIVGSATGGTAPYSYSIDGTNYQSNGSFDDLSDGTYTLYVKDANGCIETELITIVDAGSSVGMEEMGLSYSVFPNPTNGIVNVEMHSTLGKIDISLVDIMGKKIHVVQLTSEQGSTQFDLSEYAAGIYFIQITGGTQSETIRIIKR